MVIGLTGGIASGKSSVSNILRKMGVPIFDADKIAREVSEESAVIEEVALLFGPEVIAPDGKINRSALKELVFSDGEKLAALNKLIHPRVIARFEEIRNKIPAGARVVFDIPLLFESGLEFLCDKILVVDVEEGVQIERLLARDHISPVLAREIIAAQLPLSEKKKRADFVIENNGNPEDLRLAVLALRERIL